MTRERFRQKIDTATDLLKLSDPKAAISLASIGAIVVGLNTTLVNSFNLPAAYTAFGLSVVFAILLLEEAHKKLIHVLITALVIFHLARGGNMSFAQVESTLRADLSSITEVDVIGSAYATEISNNFVVISDPIPTNKPIFRPW